MDKTVLKLVEKKKNAEGPFDDTAPIDSIDCRKIRGEKIES